MTRAIARLAPLAALAALLGGCTTVRVAAPFGDVPAVLDPADWNGTWCDASQLQPLPGSPTLSAESADCGTLTVVDAAAGILDVTPGLDTEETLRVYLRYVGDDRGTLYATVLQPEGFSFELRVQRDANVIVGWDVAGDAFATEVEAGRMAGSQGEHVVDLGSPAPEVLTRIARDERMQYFVWKQPCLLVRVSGGS